MKTFSQQFFALAGLLFVASASAQDFAIDRFDLVSGAGTSTDGSFAVSGAIRQAKADPMSDGTYTIEGRFLSLIAAVPPPPATTTIFDNSGGSENGNFAATANTWLASKDRKSTRLNSSHIQKSRMPSSA